MNIYYDLTKPLIGQLRGGTQMSGMTRVALAWGIRLATRQDCSLISGLPSKWIEETIPRLEAMGSAETRLKWQGAGTWPLQDLLRLTLARSGLDRSLSSRCAGFLSHHLVGEWAERKTFTMLGKVAPPHPWIYHIPLPMILPASLPPRCIPVMSIYDVITIVFRDTYSSSARKTFDRIISSLKKHQAHLIVNSADTRHSLVSHYNLPPSHIHIVPLGADSFQEKVSEPSPASLPVGKKPFFLYVASSGQRRKNVPSTIQAFRKFLEITGEEADLVITGAGTDIHQALADSIIPPNRGNVYCLGSVSDNMLESLYATARVGLYLSIYEGFGLPILEYMNRGVPVICGQETSLPEVAGDAAILVDSLDIPSIASAMACVWQSEEIRTSLKNRGEVRAKAYTWDASHELLQKSYSEILALAH